MLEIKSLLTNSNNKTIHNKIRTLDELVWGNKMQWSNLETWLDNFKKRQEQEFALELLSNFTYYNHNEIKSLCRSGYELLKNKIKLDFIKNNISISDMDDAIKENCYFVGTWGEHVIKSGPHLLLPFAKVNKLAKYNIFKTSITKIPKTAQYVIFFDDMIGSGRQATAYWENEVVKAKSKFPNTKFYYLVLVTTLDGIKLISKKTDMEIIPVITLNDKHKAFSKNSIYFPDSNKREKIKQMCLHYGKICHPEAPLGFGDGQLLVGFSHNIPDNTLPIIWSTENEWNGIFPRDDGGNEI